MGQIKNSAGQVFDDFSEWKKWAESPSEKWSGKQNILPELVKFLSFYPWIITEKSESSDLTEHLSEKLRTRMSGDDIDIFENNSWYEDAEIYHWRDILYNFMQMNLRENADGTYTLEKLKDIKGGCLSIPDLVSFIEPDALSGKSLDRVHFPDNFVSSSPIKIDFNTWSSPSVITMAPLNIICSKEAMNKLFHERFHIKYTEFKLLYELYPAAFKPDGEGKVWADYAEWCTSLDGYFAHDVRMVMLSESEKFVQINPKTMFPPKPFDTRGDYNYETLVGIVGEERAKRHIARINQFQAASIVAVELMQSKSRIFAQSFDHPVVIPASVDTLFVNLAPSELVIEGNPHNVILNEKPGKLKINAPLKQVNADNIVRLYKETFGKDRERYVFNVPELCEENSIIPGYIRATLAFRDGVEVYDEITEINTRFIVSMSSVEITHRDHPVIGTRIHMASNGIERHQTLVVYEPMEMIAEKIAKVATQDIIEPSKIGTYE